MTKKKVQTRPALVSSVSGWSVTLGELVAGRPFTCDAGGQEMPVALMRETAKYSQFIDLTEVEVDDEPEPAPEPEPEPAEGE